MRTPHRLLLATLFLLPGCLDGPVSEEETMGFPVPDTWGDADRVLVARRDVPRGGVVEFDVLCAFGGTDFYDLQREGSIPRDAAALEFVVRSGATTTGVQAGYERDEAITWLPTVSGGAETFRVDADAVGARVDFKYQLNTVDDEACYTGASLGDYSIHVYAVRT